MICTTCQGRRTRPIVLYRSEGEVVGVLEGPCLDCGGSGHVSCCDTAGAGIAEGGTARKEDEE
jgi:hypothetical protein